MFLLSDTFLCNVLVSCYETHMPVLKGTLVHGSLSPQAVLARLSNGQDAEFWKNTTLEAYLCLFIIKDRYMGSRTSGTSEIKRQAED